MSVDRTHGGIVRGGRRVPPVWANGVRPMRITTLTPRACCVPHRNYSAPTGEECPRNEPVMYAKTRKNLFDGRYPPVTGQQQKNGNVGWVRGTVKPSRRSVIGAPHRRPTE